MKIFNYRMKSQDIQEILYAIQDTINNNSSLIKNAIGNSNIRDALIYASRMIEELKNPLLPPKAYYTFCKYSYHS